MAENTWILTLQFIDTRQKYEINHINAVNILILKVMLTYFWICFFEMFYYNNMFQVTSYKIHINTDNFSFSIVTAIAYFS